MNSNIVYADSIVVENHPIEFEIEGGNVLGMSLDQDFIELIVEIESTDDGLLQISIPRDLLDSKFENMDDIFFIIVEGFETEYVEINNGADTRTLLIPFFLGDTQIEIIGTDVLEESIEELISEPEIEFPSDPEIEIPSETEIEIPSWVKSNAGWWADGLIGDSDFVQGIQYLITNGIMTIPSTESGTSTTQQIPIWIRNNAGWWATNQINDSDFVSGIQYLITNGIMKI